MPLGLADIELIAASQPDRYEQPVGIDQVAVYRDLDLAPPPVEGEIHPMPFSFPHVEVKLL